LNRTIKEYGLVSLKGLAMGAADVIPGVSGGTIAFITGIYQELLDTIASFNLRNLTILFKQGPKAFWRAVNGNFLVALLGGIALSVVSFAKVFGFLLTNHPVPTWAFFFGLVAASIPLISRQVKVWSGSKYIAFIAGAIIAWLITSLPSIPETDSTWYLFMSGMIAICAMILPGISGSFILILLGSYRTILAALNGLDFPKIFTFAAGAIVGLLAFSHLLKLMFRRFHDLTVATLAGFLLGSLNKIWPWKETVEWYVKHQGTPKEQRLPLLQDNIWPGQYTRITGEPAELGLAIGAVIGGFLFIYAIDRFARKQVK